MSNKIMACVFDCGKALADDVIASISAGHAIVEVDFDGAKADTLYLATFTNELFRRVKARDIRNKVRIVNASRETCNAIAELSVHARTAFDNFEDWTGEVEEKK